MTNLINQLNNYTVSSTGLNQQDLQKSVDKSKQVIADNFESNSAVKTISGSASSSSKMEVVKFIPGLYLIDKFIDSTIGAENGLLHKIANVGDSISSFLHLDNIISENNAGKINNFIQNNRFTKYFTDNYKAEAKMSIAKGHKMSGEYKEKLISSVADFKFSPTYSNLLNQGKDKLSNETLKVFGQFGPLNTGLSNDYLCSVQKGLLEISSRVTNEADKEAIVNLQKTINNFLNNNNANAKTTLNLANEISSVLSRFKNTQAYPEFIAPHKNPLSSETLKILSSVNNKTQSAANVSTEQLFNAVDDIIEQASAANSNSKGLSNLSILNNKAKAANSKLGKTIIGKGLAKGTLKTKDIITYGGGLVSLYFMANALNNAMKETKEAPEGEKLNTFMHVLSEQYVGLILFQPSISLLYKIGGNKYRGMNVEGREALKKLVQNTNANPSISKEGLKIAKLQSKLLLKGVDKNKVADLAGKSLQDAKQAYRSLSQEGTKLKLWEKPLKLAGTLLDTGLDTIRKNKTIKLPFLGQKKLPSFKGFFGGAARFILILMVLQPLLSKPLTKLCHKLFGEPKAYLKKQNKTAETNDTNADNKIQNDNNSSKQTNLLKKYLNNNTDNSSNINNKPSKEAIPSANIKSSSNNKQVYTNSESQPLAPQNSDTIPAFNLFNKDTDKTKTTERYIPSIDNPAANAENDEAIEKYVNEVIAQTDAIKKEAEKLLNS